MNVTKLDHPTINNGEFFQQKMFANHQLPVAERRFRLPHFPSDIVAASQLVAEALAIRVDHQAADTAEGLTGRRSWEIPNWKPW